MGRNKTVVCGKCYRVMRMDNMTRHIKMHEKHREKQEEFTPSIASSLSYESNGSIPSAPTYTILDNTKNQCKMAYFDESTLDKRVNIGHFHNNLFQIFRLQCCSQLRTILEQSHQFDNCFFSKLSIISISFHLFQFSN